MDKETPIPLAHGSPHNLATPRDVITNSVVHKFQARAEAGRVKYGKTMARTDLTKKQWMIHAQEEAMDFVVYLERLILEEDSK